MDDVARCVTAGYAQRLDWETENFVATPVVPYDFFNITAPVNRQNRKDGDPCHTLARDNADRATLMLGDEYTGWAVRRLTPTECARLQGFDDNHCRIPWRGKPAEQCPDGPQYKAYGNSMSTNVMRWIGERIQFVDQIKRTAVQPLNPNGEA